MTIDHPLSECTATSAYSTGFSELLRRSGILLTLQVAAIACLICMIACMIAQLTVVNHASDFDL